MIFNWTGEKDTEVLANEVKLRLLRPGSVALLPTETVYALVCRADDAAGCEKIVELKKRPASKRFGWFVSDWRKLGEHGVCFNKTAEVLAEKFMPGALTLIVPSQKNGTQGIRIPDHPLLLALLKMMDEPLIQTSANASGNPDPRTAVDALAQLNGEVDIAVDGGELPSGCCGSTVVDLCDGFKMLRAGGVPESALRSALQDCDEL